MKFPLAVLFTVIAPAGLGAIGTQALIYGFVSHDYETSARAAGVARAAGFGRPGGIVGPLLGGYLIAAGSGIQSIFRTFALIALAGALMTLLVPAARRGRTTAADVVEAETVNA